MNWNFPVFQREQKQGSSQGGTVARAVSRALPLQEAVSYIADEDRRPLLILRECRMCNGTDDALLSRKEDNTRTLLMARWFNCVKMPMDVLEDDHPFHALFSEELWADQHMPHLFLAKWDGSGMVPLLGDQSRTELWDKMFLFLESEYEKDAEDAVRDLEKIITQYDVQDQRIMQLELQLDREIEKRGPDSRKVKKIRRDLREAREELDALKKKEAKISDLKLDPSVEDAQRLPAGR